ncbi:InlB B-repeat-containing protein, partial [Porcincola intestinalis]|uniref:InlB B-repeat-containing protein n=1 Tax=Porcincola intestinalis TaxID=2606632 RepID=UPI002A915452
MKTQRKRLAAVLLSATLTLSNLAGILPQSNVLAAEESVQTEIAQAESASSEAQPAPAAAEAAQQPAPAPAAEAAQPAPAPAAEAAQPAPAPAEEPAAAAPAESVSTPEPASSETPAAPQQESAAPAESQSAESSAADTQQSASNGKLTAVYYAAAEGGSVSSASEVVQASSGQTVGSEAKAAEGFAFKNWTAPDGTVVSTSAFFAPHISSATNDGSYTYTAHFEKVVEAPVTKMITVEYVAGNGGTVDRGSETVDVLSADAALLGSTATAQEGYQFVDWTASDDSIVSSNASFVPALSADMPEKTVYTANFKKTDTMPAQDFEGSVSGVSVRVHADEGRFPEGTTMHLAPVSKASILNNDSVQDAVGEDKEVVDAIAVDITFLNKDGKEIEPVGTISVSMSTSRDVSGDSHQVLHIDDSGNASQVTDASAEGASFEASEFSIYVIAGANDPAIATYFFYDADGKVISTQKVKHGETVYAPTTPEKAGSKFLGWSYTQDVSSIQKGDPGDFGTLTASVSTTGDVRLYPVFQQAYYVFFLDKQDRVSTTKEGTSGSVIEVSDVTIPLDSTHSVTGWYTEAELTHKVESITLSDHNVTLYPKVETGHYLYFSSGEGASYVKPVFVAAGKNTVEPEAPTRPGYTFKYWSASEDGSEYEFGSTIEEDTTLHAVWEANRDTQYTVIYWWENANDDNYSYHENSTATGITGSKIDLNEIKKDYDGFTRNAEKTNAANEDAVIAGDGSTIVNVYYSRNTYEIKFFESTWSGDWFGGSYSWDEMTNLRISAKYGENISDRWPTSTSKIWGTKQGSNGQGAQPYQSGISTMPLGGASFYYVEQSGQYTMNLHYYLEGLDGQYHLHHTDSFKTDNPTRWSITAEDYYDIEGFTYNNNVKDGSGFERESKYVYEVSFEYSRNSYSIKFVNGNSTTSETFKYGADISKVDLKTAPNRPNGIPSDYKFAGWFDNKLGVGDPATLTGTMPAHNITLYAKWEAPKYTGTVHTTIDGTGTPMQLTINYGSTINENDLPTVKDSDGNVIQEGSSSNTVTVPKGNTWAGWATKSGDDFTIYNFNTQVHSDIILYPYYINGEKYTVTYSLGDGTGTTPIDSKQYAKNSYADIQSASEVTPPTGKTFLYWSHGTDKYYPGDKVKITDNLELTAVYGETSPLTSITYHSNYPEGSELDEKTTTVDNQANNTAIMLEKAGFSAPNGYYFSYWKDKSGERYDVGKKIGIDNSSANNLYAVWEQKKEITLTANSGTFTYDGSEHSASGVKTDTFTIDSVTYTVSGFTTENPKKKNAGTYTNNILNTDSIHVKNGDIDVTYQFSVKTENGSLNITPKAVTVTADDKSKTYGTADPELTAKVSGTLDKDTVSYTLSRAEGEDVGTYTITPAGDKSQGNYTVTYETGTLT